jgi:hypothetical protein
MNLILGNKTARMSPNTVSGKHYNSNNRQQGRAKNMSKVTKLDKKTVSGKKALEVRV